MSVADPVSSTSSVVIAPTPHDHAGESRVAETLSELRRVLGDDGVLTDPETLTVFGTDILGPLEPPVAVLRPTTVEHAAQAVERCLAAGLAINTRGGGASYTQAHVPATTLAVVLDCTALDRIIAIDEEDMTVTVEPGVTWKALDDALAERGLRTPFWGPYSGLKSTVGGALSQHAISLGSGLYDASNSVVTGMKVITGRGEVIDTGTTPSRFYRTYGPDLTGLFTGDSGAFGVKLEATLRLIRRPTHVEGSCFVYPEFADMARAMMEAARENLASEIMAIDPQLQQGQLGSIDSSAALGAAKAIFRSSPGVWSGLRAVLTAALRGRSALKAPGYLVNYITEGRSAGEARFKLDSIRQTVGQGGVEVANTLALALRAMPFRPFTPVLGPQGERWLPMHCVLPFSQVQPFHQALSAHYEQHAAEMAEHRVHIATMFVTVSSTGFVYEPTFYWQDSQHAAHRDLVPDDHRQKLPVYPANPEARAFVRSMKEQMIALMQAHGATHYQLGKSYPFMSTREPGAAELLRMLKRQFDPQNLMNPGVLEFPTARTEDN
ncbi:MAG: FAD-binding oxidoreductase [Pseudomonadota bacterium]